MLFNLRVAVGAVDLDAGNTESERGTVGLLADDDARSAVEANGLVLERDQERILALPRCERNVLMRKQLREAYQPQRRVLVGEVAKRQVVAEINNHLVLVGIRAVECEGVVAVCLWLLRQRFRGAALRDDAAADEFVETALPQLIHKRLAIDI